MALGTARSYNLNTETPEFENWEEQKETGLGHIGRSGTMTSDHAPF